MSFWESLRGLFTEREIVIAFLAAAAIVFFLTPLVARVAPLVGAVDDPIRSDRPRVHTRPLPRIGGLAIVVGILAPASLVLDPTGPYVGILLGTLAVAALGLVDDVRGVPPSVKLAGVALAALIPVGVYDVSFSSVEVPLLGAHDVPGWLAIAVTVFWITLVANLVNLIDGMDSLAAGIVAIAAFSFALLAVSFFRFDAAILAATVCGATLAFLPHNYYPARIIMGDTGALALGFLLAALAVEGVLKTAATIALVAPLLAIAVPVLDTSFVILKRLKYRRPPWSADQNHFYHRFLRIGFSQRKTAAYLHAWAALLAGSAILIRFVPPRPFGEWNLVNSLIVGAMGLFVLAASAWMVYTLEILKARHLRVLGFGRWAAQVEEREEAVERAVTAAHR